MTTDRFRPDAALRGIVPLPAGRPTVLLRQSGGQVAEVLAAPSPATWASEVNKDRSGKHGSEVA